MCYHLRIYNNSESLIKYWKKQERYSIRCGTVDYSHVLVFFLFIELSVVTNKVALRATLPHLGILSTHGLCVYIFTVSVLSNKIINHNYMTTNKLIYLCVMTLVFCGYIHIYLVLFLQKQIKIIIHTHLDFVTVTKYIDKKTPLNLMKYNCILVKPDTLVCTRQIRIQFKKCIQYQQIENVCY